MSFRSDIENSIKFVSNENLDSFTAQFCFHPRLAVFKGHFPGRPLIPGVMQIEMAVIALEKLQRCNYTLVKVKKAKFIREIHPGDIIDMFATKIEEESVSRLTVKLEVALRQVASLSIILRQENISPWLQMKKGQKINE